jgi:hypothetical protein
MPILPKLSGAEAKLLRCRIWIQFSWGYTRDIGTSRPTTQKLRTYIAVALFSM